MAREFGAALVEHQCQARTVEIKQRTHMSILLNITQDSDPAEVAILDFISKHTRE
jgi:hypothetical protein